MNDKNFELAKRLRRELHRHPELSMEEVWTKKHLIEFLNENTTKWEIVNRGRWFYAVYRAKCPKKKIAFRGDFDALPVPDEIDAPYRSEIPGVGHKCGHDGHAANLCLTALEIEENDAENDVYLVFQHAEEIGGGGAECAVLMEEEHIDEVYAYHSTSGLPFNTVKIRDGHMNCASKGMEIIFTGIPAHASTPEFGRNPAFAVAELIQAIPGFIVPEEHQGLILCTVIQVDIGERAFGVSAYKGKLLLTIRGEYEEEMNRLQKRLEELAIEQAKRYDLDCKFAFYDEFPETVNHPEAARKIREAANALGLSVWEMPKPNRGSEDFGHFTKKTMGARFQLGNGVEYPTVHDAKFDFIDEQMKTATGIFLELIK